MCKTTKCEGNIKKISLEMNLNNFGKLEKNVVVDLHNNFYQMKLHLPYQVLCDESISLSG